MATSNEDDVYERGKDAMDALGLTLSPWLLATGPRAREVAHQCYAIRVSGTTDQSTPRRPSRTATVDSEVLIRVASRIRADNADADYSTHLALRQTVRAAMVPEATGSAGGQGPQHWRWVSSVEATSPDPGHLFTDHTFTVRHELAAF